MGAAVDKLVVALARVRTEAGVEKFHKSIGSPLGPSFVLRSNMKAAEGSQGTLFQGNTPSPGHGGQPWPRGFSPERRARVTEALGWYSPALGGNRGQKTRGDGAAIRSVSLGLENVARSTVPVTDLRGVDVRFGADAWQMGSGSSRGVYRRNAYLVTGRDSPAIHVSRGNEMTPSVIHELGHHVSSMRGTAHSQAVSSVRTPAQRGQEEGFADKYADEHYRNLGKPRSQDKHGAWAEGLTDREAEQFQKHYEATRSANTPTFAELTPRQLKRQLALFVSRNGRWLRTSPQGYQSLGVGSA